MLGVDAPVSFELLRQIVLGVVVNTIVALPMWALTRRALEGALPEDPRRRRRRRAYTTGGLSPLSKAMSAIEPVRPRDPRVPVSPQLALRVAIIGGVAMVMFGVIFFRLWYLQVLSGEQYVTQANANRARHLPIAAPRGADPRPRRPADRGQHDDQRGADRARASCPPASPPRWPNTRAASTKPKRSRTWRVARLSSFEASLGGVRRLTHAQRRRARDACERASRPARVAVPPLPALGGAARRAVRAPRAA